MSNNINCFYQNVRGLNTKLTEFYNNTLQSEYDLVAITETWLKDGVSDNEVINNNYILFRSDRKFDLCNKTRGGGVLLAVKDNLKATSVPVNLQNVEIDLLCVKIYLKFKHFYVIVFYLPPDSTQTTYNDLFACIETIHFLKDSNIIILGDLNVPELNDYYNGLANSNLVNSFQYFLSATDLIQYNKVANTDNRILDIIAANVQCSVEKSEGLVTEDIRHPALLIDIEITSPSCQRVLPSNTPSYNFRRANFDQLTTLFFAQDWSALYSINNVEDAFEKFRNIIYDIFDASVPKTIRKNKYPPWFTLEIKNDIKEKEKNRKLYKKRKEQIYLENFKYLRSKIKRDINIAYGNYTRQAEGNISANPKSFWSYVNSKKKHSRLPPVMTYNHTELFNGDDIVEALADNFKKVFNKDQNIDIDHFNYCKFTNNCVLNTPKVLESDIQEAIKKLKPKAAPGPDNIPAYVVKGCSEVLVRPLCYLLNLSLSQCCFPSLLKLSRVCPLFKAGDKCDCQNYRPISILSCISKIFEKVLYKYIYNHVKTSITQHQHGFISKKSTSSNLLNFVEYTHEAFVNKFQVDAVYTDFQKAFDKVGHSIILHKLKVQYGFSDNFCLFIESYLRHRRQTVFYNGYSSSTYIPTSGVPQGSNLGPLLFILFVNDITTVVQHSEIRLFADDAKLFLKIRNISDCEKLQIDVQNIYKWSEVNMLPLNISKCSTMTYSFKSAENNIEFDYIINNDPLKRVQIVKDLGVYMDPKLKFDKHIENLTKECYKKNGFLIRNCKDFKNIKTYVTLFNVLIRPKLEYACVVWDPYYARYHHDIEKIQSKFYQFANFYLKLYNLYEYNIFIRSFQIVSLEHRRHYIKLCYLYKILNYYVDDSYILARINISIPNAGIRHYRTFRDRLCTTNYTRYSPINHMMILYNNIQFLECDIFADSFSRYKNILKGYFQSI